MFGHRRAKSRNVEEDSLVSRKGETKKQLKEKLSSRPDQASLEQRGILQRGSETTSSKGSAKKIGSRKESRNSIGPGQGDRVERRKSSVFGRSKSSKMSVDSIQPLTGTIGLSVPACAERDGLAVPKLVQQCIDELWQRGFEEPGIFRVSGDKTQMDRIVEAFDRGEPAQLADADLHVVASLLKLFFRMASVPLFTLEAHEQFLATVGAADGVQRYAELLKGLPATCLQTVQVLFPLLRAVADRSEVNMMTPANLGIVFGPTLLRSAAELAGEIDMSNRSAYTVEFLITNWSAISVLLPVGPSSPSSPSPPAKPNALPPAPSLSAAPSASMGSLPPPTRAPGTPVMRKGPPPVAPGQPASLSVPDLSKLPPPAALPPAAAASGAPAPSAAALPPPAATALPPASAAAAPAVVASPLAPRRPLPGPPPGAPKAAVAAAAVPPPVAGASSPPSLPAGARSSTALYDFTGDKSKGQIDVKKGDALVVLQTHAAGWSAVECEGRKGYIPASYHS